MTLRKAAFGRKGANSFFRKKLPKTFSGKVDRSLNGVNRHSSKKKGLVRTFFIDIFRIHIPLNSSHFLITLSFSFVKSMVWSVPNDLLLL